VFLNCCRIAVFGVHGRATLKSGDEKRVLARNPRLLTHYFNFGSISFRTINCIPILPSLKSLGKPFLVVSEE
jgi:hypothetical protein